MKSDVRANANTGEAATDKEVFRIGMVGENYCSKKDKGTLKGQRTCLPAFPLDPSLTAELFTPE